MKVFMMIVAVMFMFACSQAVENPAVTDEAAKIVVAPIKVVEPLKLETVVPEVKKEDAKPVEAVKPTAEVKKEDVKVDTKADAVKPAESKAEPVKVDVKKLEVKKADTKPVVKEIKK